MTLKVGDICEVIRSIIPETVPVGTIVTICDPDPKYGLPPVGQICFIAEGCLNKFGEHIFAGGPKDLRKIPPKQGTTTWDQCVWQPKGVEV